MKHLIGSKASRFIAFLLTAVILLCAVPSSTAADAPRFWYNDAQDARLKALDCLMTCAFSNIRIGFDNFANALEGAKKRIGNGIRNAII